MGPKTQELIDELEACAGMLRSCSENHWASWLERSSSYLKQGQFKGVEHFKRAFGGMGSINDLVLTPLNGHTIQETEIAFYNEKMLEHFSKAHSLIKDIEKNAEFEK